MEQYQVGMLQQYLVFGNESLNLADESSAVPFVFVI